MGHGIGGRHVTEPKSSEGQLPSKDYRPWVFKGLTCPAAPLINLGTFEARGNTFNLLSDRRDCVESAVFRLRSRGFGFG